MEEEEGMDVENIMLREMSQNEKETEYSHSWDLFMSPS